jgi:hypothetical protein
MNELKLYIETLKTIIDVYYEKEVVFYEDGKWYSRCHSRYITPEELTGWVIELIQHMQNEKYE